jgi:hypothetical protein
MNTYTVAYTKNGKRYTWRNRTHEQVVKLTEGIAKRAHETGGIHTPTVRTTAGDFVTNQFPALALL